MALGNRVRRLATLTAVALLAAACSADPTDSAEYREVVAERDQTQARLDAALDDLDEVRSQLEEVTAALEAARAQLVTTTTIAAPDYSAQEAAIDAEVFAVCTALSGDHTGNGIANADVFLDFDPAWEVVAAESEVIDRIEDCAAFDYLVEIALGGEFGESIAEVHKWVGTVTILVEGSPTTSDMAAIDDVISDLDRIINTVTFQRVTSGPADLTVHYAPPTDFPSILPQYVPGNDGFFWIWWDGSGRLTNGTILIRSDLDPGLRAHLIREELTQSLGMANDSFRYEDSIFQQAFTTVGDYAAVDEQIIEMLYRPEVLPGMDAADLAAALDWSFGD